LKKAPKELTRATANRRGFLQTGLLGSAAALVYPVLGAARAASAIPTALPEVKTFELDEITITALQERMKSGQYSSRSITEKYLQRIADIDKQGPL